MTEPNSSKPKPKRPLREQAEAALRASPPDIERMTPLEIQKLVHELQVHQIELEMQNEELRDAQAELAHSRDRFADLYDFTPAGYVTLDKDGTVLEANLTMATMCGIDRKGLTGRKYTHFIAPASQDQYYHHHHLVFDSDHKQTCDLVLRRADGTTFPVRMETVCLHDPMTGSKQCRSAILDVTERRRAEDELARSHAELEDRVAARTSELAAANRELEANQERLRQSAGQIVRLAAIVESSGDAIIGRNMEGIIESWNDGAQQLYGYTQEEAIGKAFASLLVPPELNPDYCKILEKLKGGTSLEAVETVRLHKDGHRIEVSVRLSSIRNDDDAIIGVSSIARDITRQKRAEAALRESEERLRLVLQASGIGTYEIDLASGEVHWNSVEFELLGLKPGEAPASPETFFRFVHPDDAGWLRSQWDEGLKTGEFDAEFRIVRADGKERWIAGKGRFAFETKATGTVPSAGSQACFLGVNFDITARRLADEMLRASEARFRLMADHSPVLIWISGTGGQRTWVNRRWLEFTGQLMAAELGDGWLQRIHPNDQARCRRISDFSFEARKPMVMEYRLRRYDGEWRWMLDHSIPLIGPGGEFTGYIGSCMDITVREEAERKVRAALREVDHIKAVLDEHSIVAVTDAHGRIIFVNDRFCEISGYSREELLGNTHRIVNSGRHSQEFFREMWETITSGKVWRGEIENRAKDGTHYFVATTIVPRPGPDGKPEQYVAIRTDITEHKAASERLQRLSHELAAKNRDLETLIHAASHDLRTPLVNVQGFASLISEQTGRVRELLREAVAGRPPPLDLAGAVTSEIEESVRYICAGAEKMDALLRGLLIFSRLGRAAMVLEQLDADAIVKESLAATRFQLETSGATVTAKPLPPCLADANLFGQTISNLIDNAIKYRDPHRPLHIDISGHSENNRSIYRFADNGIGIAPEHRDKVFELFHRLNPRHGDGHGLGLAIVRRAMDRMQGSITVESAPDGGTVFFLSLPAPSTEPHAKWENLL